MAIVARNFYDANDVLLNDVPILVGQSFTLPGLQSNVDLYLRATNIDQAGLESVKSDPFPFSTLAVAPPPVEGPLPAADVTVIDGIVTAAMAANGQLATTISITGPRGFLTKSYGTTGARLVTPDDHFRMGSVTKSFTGTAVLQQVALGNLSLDDTLDQYVTGVPSGDVMTIRNIMQMRSGAFDYQTDQNTVLAFVFNPQTAWSQTSALNLIKSRPSGFVPGTAYQYTNSNYVLLGFVLEAVTGLSIKQILADVASSAGLTETQWPPNAALPLPWVNGYGANPLKSIPILGWFVPAVNDQSIYNPELFGAAGALTSTIGDLQKWGKHLRDGDLLTPEMHELRESTFLTYPQARDVGTGPTTFGYGLGYVAYGDWLGHDGSVPGYECCSMYEPESGAVIATFANYQTPALQVFLRTFHRIADYLYPGTMAATPTFTGARIRPASAVVSITGGVPNVSVTTEGSFIPDPAVVSVTGGTPIVTVVHNKVITPASAVVSITGGTPGANPIVVQPDSAVVSVTGGTPTVTVVAFTPFSEENLNRIDRAVPAAATEWRFTGIGPGGPGGAGRKNSISDNLRGGGGGGGGGAKVSTGWLSVDLLGPTYSVTRGLQGVGGAPSAGNGNGGFGIVGTASTFVSGSVSLSAGPGGRGAGAQSNTGGASGAGGTGSAAGATATVANGTAGTFGQSSAPVNNAVANASGGGGGGGGGGGTSANDGRHGGGNGGSSATQTGGVGGALAGSGGSTAATAAGVAGGGSGGGGSTVSGSSVKGGAALGYGGGGGGGGAAKSTVADTSGDDGGPSYTNIEWR